MATVAVGAILFDGPKVLLVKRGTSPGKGLWSVPGGKVREGETLREACAREMREETRLSVEAGPLVEVVEYIDPRFHYVILDFLVHLLGGCIKAGSDVEEVGWFDLEDIPRLPTTQNLQDVLHKAYKKQGKGPCSG